MGLMRRFLSALYGGFHAALRFLLAVLVRISHRGKIAVSDASVNPPARTIDLGKVQQMVGQDPIWAIRGKAVGAYSTFEQSLFMLFQSLLKAPMDRAAIVFFKITNTQARNAILEKLVHKEFGTTYNKFWNDYVDHLRPIDTRRNEIVHWAVVNKIASEEAVEVVLSPPNFWINSPTAPELSGQDLVDFIVKCDVYARLATMFAVMTPAQSQIPLEQRQPWLDIFQQPLVYPLPAGHPLNRPPQAPGSQPQPSQGSAQQGP